MRIIAGKFKGIGILSANDKSIRPLKDMVRESIFNFLLHSNKISFQLEGSNILDLYSGTGSFGIECLSRNAGNVVFVEKEKQAIKILERNILKTKTEKNSKIFPYDVLSIMKMHDEFFFDWLEKIKIDLIFCDPPFKDISINNLINLIYEKNILKKDGLIVIHRHKSTKEKMTSNFKVIDERVYGLSRITYGKIS